VAQPAAYRIQAIFSCCEFRPCVGGFASEKANVNCCVLSLMRPAHLAQTRAGSRRWRHPERSGISPAIHGRLVNSTEVSTCCKLAFFFAASCLLISPFDGRGVESIFIRPWVGSPSTFSTSCLRGSGFGVCRECAAVFVGGAAGSRPDPLLSAITGNSRQPAEEQKRDQALRIAHVRSASGRDLPEWPEQLCC